MVRSPSFCFSIKGCAGKADDDDFSAPRQVKESPEKRRWSFRKKHVGHHVSSNNIMSEPLPPFSENQNRDAHVGGTFYSETSLSDPQKVTSAEQTSPTLQSLSSVVSSGVLEEFSSTSTALVNDNVPEHVIIIQTSIRRCLAQNELQKLKNVVKLQAAARGFLVRRQAAGSLRCIQAIVKMQALVRARQSAELIEKTNLDESVQADAVQVKQSNKELAKTPSVIRKLVSSAFARQLLESTPKANSIRISCDPLRPDSGWIWLERWMALTSMDQQKLIPNPEDLKKNITFDSSAYEIDDGVHVVPHLASSDSLLAGNSPEVIEILDDLITKSSRIAELSAPTCVSDQLPTSTVQDNELQSLAHETVTMENRHDQSKREAKEISLDNLDASLHFELDVNLSKPDYTEDSLKNSARNELISAEKCEGDKALNGHRKSKNPAFAAVQAKFEELSSASDSNLYFNYVSSVVVSVSKSPSSQVDFTSKEHSEIKQIHSNNVEEVNLHEKLSSHSPKNQGASSRYATEIFVDSPKDSVTENFPEQTIFDEINHGALSDTNGLLKFDEIKAETKNDLPKLVTAQPQEKESSKNAAVQVDENAEDIYADKPSPYGTLRSHRVVKASSAALSSPKSLIVRIAKAEDSSPARKIKSQLAVRNSPTHSLKNSPTHSWNDSDARRGTKNLKRPNSSGSDRTNYVDHEDRNSSKSLPSYMQLTESAKAKINTNFSHKSTIGFHHKDNLIKKRHSLPIGNEKQGLSPRIQSPKSQTSQDLKGSSVSIDNSNERRWQI